jgi:hypothetical protein
MNHSMCKVDHVISFVSWDHFISVLGTMRYVDYILIETLSVVLNENLKLFYTVD